MNAIPIFILSVLLVAVGMAMAGCYELLRRITTATAGAELATRGRQIHMLHPDRPPRPLVP